MIIRLHSIYNNVISFTQGRIPKELKWSTTEGKLHCYVDSEIYTRNISKNSIALLIEPRSIQPDVYRFIETNGKRFKYIFTHDSTLLFQLDNTKLMLFGGIYGEYNIPKTKGISMVSSNKEMCELHKIRTDICRQLKNQSKSNFLIVDCYGNFDGGEYATTEQIYGAYKYSIVIENYKDDYWFTEKICNAFANKTVPIYYGARKITDYFNSSGIIQVDNPYDVFSVIENLDIDKDYCNRLPSIIQNYHLVQQFKCFEDWFYFTYKNLLEQISV